MEVEKKLKSFIRTFVKMLLLDYFLGIATTVAKRERKSAR